MFRFFIIFLFFFFTFFFTFLKFFPAVFFRRRSKGKPYDSDEYQRSAQYVVDCKGLAEDDCACYYGYRCGSIAEYSGLNDLHMSQHVCHELRRQQYAENTEESYGDKELRMCYSSMSLSNPSVAMALISETALNITKPPTAMVFVISIGLKVPLT